MYVDHRTPITLGMLPKMIWGKKVGPPSDEGSFLEDAFFTFMGRDAIALGIEQLGLTQDDTVLLPAYLCHEVLNPFLGKTKILFYDLNPDLTIDLELIGRILSRNRVKAVYAIHYFGFLQRNIEELKKLCEEKGAYLFEDCAHALLTSEAGRLGDVVIYSFRKLFPLPDGGAIKVQGERKLRSIKYYPRLASDFAGILILLKSMLSPRNQLLTRKNLGVLSNGKGHVSRQPAHNSKSLGISTFSKNLLSHLDLEDIRIKRKKNFERWQELATGAPYRPLFDSLTPATCPLGFPVVLSHRDRIIQLMEQKNVFLKVHWPLPEEIDKEFKNAWNLSQRIVTLPVYEALAESNITRLNSLLRSVY